MNGTLSQPAAAQYRLAPTVEPVTQADSQSFDFCLRNGAVDRYGDTIDPNGWDHKDFDVNGPALFGHDASSVENFIGRWINVRVENGKLLGTLVFMDGSTNPRAEVLRQMVLKKFLKTVSVGFLPLEWQFSSDKSRPGGIDFKKQVLLECSLVPVPANPGALVQAKAIEIDIERLGFSADSGDARADSHQFEQDSPSMIRRSALGHNPLISPDIADRRLKAQAAAIAIGRPSAFKSFGHFLQAIATQQDGASLDPRLIRAPAGAGDVDPTGGGFLVPTEYEEQLIGSIFEESVLAQFTDRRQTDHPAKCFLPGVNETSRVDGSRWGGVLAYWRNEGDLAPTSLPKFRMLEFNAKKLIALCVTSEELINDVPLLDSHIRRAFAAEGAFQLDRGILAGTGAGTLSGIVGAPGTVVVAKQSGQGAGTVVGENIANMWSRLALPCRRRAVWICNGDVETQMDLLGSGGSTPAAAGMYFPSGTGGNPYPLLKGRPVYFAEQSPLLGTQGDIVLADLSQYLLVDGGMKTALSMHCRFNSNEGIFRFAWRGDGRPSWPAPITPYNGGATQSAFVTLAAR